MPVTTSIIGTLRSNGDVKNTSLRDIALACILSIFFRDYAKSHSYSKDRGKIRLELKREDWTKVTEALGTRLASK